MATPAAHSDSSAEKTQRPVTSWTRKVDDVTPKNQLCVVYFGLMCALFLAALDGTIVATALPTIVENIGGGDSYSWVGSAYTLSGGACGPLYGKLSNIFGRKPVLYTSMFIFLSGSVMCGAAQSMTWLIVSRAIQGIGGAGIIQLVYIIISDVVPLKDRAKYDGFIGAMYGIAGVTGPVVGGALAEHISWRWCFFINLPTGGIAAAILFVFLNLDPHRGAPILDQLAELDFTGLVCFVAGAICLLTAFDSSRSTWKNAMTIALLIVGFLLLILGAVNEMFTKRSAILPPRLFRTRTTAIVLITTFLHATMLSSTSYYLPLFYQVIGASATISGVKMITFSLVISLTSIIPGFIISKTGRYRPIIWVAYVVLTLGMGLMTMLTYTSSLAKQMIFPVVAAFGIGSLFQAPMTALQSAMPVADRSTAMSGYWFVRTLGVAVGIAIGEVIITSTLPRKLEKIPNFDTLGLGTTASELNNSINRTHLIPDVNLRNAVLQAWSDAISMIWIMLVCMSAAALILTLFLREYSLDRKIVRKDSEVGTYTDPDSRASFDGSDVKSENMIPVVLVPVNESVKAEA